MNEEKIKIELAPIIMKKDDEKISEQRGSSSMMHLKIDDIYK